MADRDEPRQKINVCPSQSPLLGPAEAGVDAHHEKGPQVCAPLVLSRPARVHGRGRQRDDDVPRDGHAVLAGAGGGGDGCMTDKLIDDRASGQAAVPLP